MQTLNSLTDEQRLELFHKNKGLAAHIAREFGQGRLPYDNRRQTAFIGLHIASQRWDEKKGPFSSYARVVIRNGIMREVAQDGSGRFFYRRLDGAPRFAHSSHSTTARLVLADFHVLAGILPDVEHMDPEDRLVQVEAALLKVDQERQQKQDLIDAAPPRKRPWRGHVYTNREVMERLAKGQTQARIAENLGVSRQRISQIVANSRKTAAEA